MYDNLFCSQDKEKVRMEFTHKELYAFYNQVCRMFVMLLWQIIHFYHSWYLIYADLDIL